MINVVAKIRSEPMTCVVERARAALDAGCAQLVLGQSFYLPEWTELLGLVPSRAVLGVELFVPLPRQLHPPTACPFRLGGSSVEEKRDAIKYGTETLQQASRHEIQFAQLPLVDLEIEGVPPRRLTDEEYERFSRRRTTAAEVRMDSYLSTLDSLLTQADDHDVTLVITPGAILNDFPNHVEAAHILHEFAGAPLAVWPDIVGETRAANRQLESSWDLYGEAIGGIVLSEVAPSGFRCLPGTGELDWDAWKSPLAESPHWIIDVPPCSSVEEIAAAREFLIGVCEESEPDDGLFSVPG